MSIEDQPTQQIRREPPAAAAPDPLNPARTAPPPVDETDNGSTSVLRLDDLFDGPASATEAPTAPPPVQAPTAAPVAPPAPAEAAMPSSAPAAPPAPAPAPQRVGVVPVATSGSEPGLRHRVRGDASAAWRGGLTRSRAWLGSGDNVVIVATVVVALLLLVVVAAL
jgi:hypothetical protein